MAKKGNSRKSGKIKKYRKRTKNWLKIKIAKNRGKQEKITKNIEKGPKKNL